MIKLYQFPISHFSEKVRWALTYKKIDYQTVNLIPGLHVKKLLKLAGRSSVPVLVDNGAVIRNSSDIISYLDNTYQDNLLTPRNSELNKQALEWEAFADKEIGIPVRCICYHTLLESPEIVIKFFSQDGPWYGPLFLKLAFPKLKQKMRQLMGINEETAAKSKVQLAAAFDKLNNQLSSGRFLVGDQFTRADLAVAALLAPLIQPAGYGLHWPDILPSELQGFIDSQANNLYWAKNIYSDFR